MDTTLPDSIKNQDHVLTLGTNFVLNDVDKEEQHCALISICVCSGREFHILLTTDPPPGCQHENAVEIGWIEGALDLTTSQQRDYLDEIGKKITVIALPTILELAPLVPGAPRLDYPQLVPHTAKEEIEPEVVKLQLVTRNEGLEVIPGHYSCGPQGVVPVTRQEMKDFDFDDVEAIPTVAATDVLLTPVKVAAPRFFNATVPALGGGRDSFLCHMMFRFESHFLRTELQKYAKIRKASLTAEARVAVLRGFVTYKGGIVGVLMDNIPIKSTLCEPTVEGEISLDPPLSLRKKWAAQLEHTVAELHSCGIVWGDACPVNVLIDEDDNAWISNFDGGLHHGWIDKSLHDTMEGDSQALARMKKALLRDAPT